MGAHESLAPPTPPVPSGTAAHWFAAAAEAWVEEHYVDQRRGGAERRSEVQRDLRLHLVPDLAARAPEPGHFNRACVLATLRLLAGRNEATIDLDRAATLTKMSDRALAAALNKASVEPAEQHGSRWVNLGDLRRATGQELRIGLAKSTSKGLLAVLRSVETHAAEHLGLIDRTYSSGLRAFDPDAAHAQRPPVPRSERNKYRAGMAEVLRVAAHLHPVWQAALWLLRLGGLRVSEAFGLRVRDVRWVDGRMVLDVHEQGGRGFLVLDEQGRTRRVRCKDELKNTHSDRTIAVPRLLAELVEEYIELFHVDPATGCADPSAPLLVGMKGALASQAGLRTALKVAVAAEGLHDDIAAPHEHRRAVSTDLEVLGVSKVSRQRYLGHEAGVEVIERHYTQDQADGVLTHPARDALDRMLDGLVDSLAVPTAKQLSPHRTSPLHARKQELAEQLLNSGWLIDPDRGGEVTLSAREVADDLDRSVSHVRRLMADGTIPSTQSDTGERRARLSDVEQYRASRGPTLHDVAEELGWSYHQTWNALRRLVPDLEAAEDRRLALADEHLEALRAEAVRIAGIEARSVTLTVAANDIFRRAPTTVRGWLRRGELAEDPEVHPSRLTYVTLASIAAHPECPDGAGRAPWSGGSRWVILGFAS
jgi:integrase